MLLPASEERLLLNFHVKMQNARRPIVLQKKCNQNTARRDCPRCACGRCCDHDEGHAPSAYTRGLEEKRAAARREEEKLAEEEQRRAAALAAAHAKARAHALIAYTAAAADDTVGPLLALPADLLALVVHTLGPDEAAAAARLACEHSKLLAAFVRTYRVFDTLDDLRAALDADRNSAAPSLPPSLPPAMQFFSHAYTCVCHAELSEWHTVAPAPPLTLLHAVVPGKDHFFVSNEWDRVLKSIEDLNASVRQIHELEIDCGLLDVDVPRPPQPPGPSGCPACGASWCKCSAEGLLSALRAAR